MRTRLSEGYIAARINFGFVKMAVGAVSLTEQNGFTTVSVRVFHNPSCALSRGVYANLQRKFLERCPGVQVASDFFELVGNGEFICVCMCVSRVCVTVFIEPFEVYINSDCVFSMRQCRRYPTSEDLNKVSIVNFLSACTRSKGVLQCIEIVQLVMSQLIKGYLLAIRFFELNYMYKN